MYSDLLKPLLDRLLGVVLLILFFIPLLIVAFLLLLIHGRGGVFFTQDRPGKGEKIFNLKKFKTMRDDRDEYGNLLPDALRITPIGKFVRKTSLDELPQLWNVCIGDMSLVGPRPLLKKYLPLYNAEQKRRHEVKPGLTGWAQVNGRNSISWEEKFKLDVWYVDNVSFSLDLKILLLTVKRVLLKEGISAEGHVTMEYFEGNK